MHSKELARFVELPKSIQDAVLQHPGITNGPITLRQARLNAIKAWELSGSDEKTALPLATRLIELELEDYRLKKLGERGWRRDAGLECPECESTKQAEEIESEGINKRSSFFERPYERSWKCMDCGHKWTVHIGPRI